MRTDYYTKYRPKGWTYWADIYCYECGVALPDCDPEGNYKNAVEPWAELPEDCYCGKCGEAIR